MIKTRKNTNFHIKQFRDVVRVITWSDFNSTLCIHPTITNNKVNMPVMYTVTLTISEIQFVNQAAT